MTTRRVVGVVGIVLAGLGGCGPGNGRVPLEGSVTWNGRPVPLGEISFEPLAGVSGVQGMAKIDNGRYRTVPEFGPRPGPLVARVSGYESRGGEPVTLFEGVEVAVEIGPDTRTLDLVVPAAQPAAVPGR